MCPLTSIKIPSEEFPLECRQKINLNPKFFLIPDNRKILLSKQYAYIIGIYLPDGMGTRDKILLQVIVKVKGSFVKIGSPWSIDDACWPRVNKWHSSGSGLSHSFIHSLVYSSICYLLWVCWSLWARPDLFLASVSCSLQYVDMFVLLCFIYFVCHQNREAFSVYTATGPLVVSVWFSCYPLWCRSSPPNIQKDLCDIGTTGA